ncbi:MAG TPA: type II toxin-antitoxin system RelE/ParE family toxin [Candidatus Eremiobacteraeota bacterium]|nr:type II toxin-antitoxin system RelE/ParE family toxin [Candidatus Eremiobacteraeota bacterium]
MIWNTGFYQKENGEIPLKEFLRNLPEKHRAKVYWGIELLKEYGTGLREPYAKSLTGEQYKGLWELRVKFASDISRIFYFIHIENTFILLHGFLKKTDETPKRELEIAKRYMDDYLRRCKK